MNIGIGNEAIGYDRIDTASRADSRRRWMLFVAPLDDLFGVVTFEAVTTTTFGAGRYGIVIVGREWDVVHPY